MRHFDLLTRRSLRSVSDLLQDIGEVRRLSKSLGTTWYYRGQHRSVPLSPKLGHTLYYAGRQKLLTRDDEEKLLHRFRRYAYEMLPPGSGEWEALFLARHYDLPTRILDWSTTPLVGLYFACAPAARDRSPSSVWGILKANAIREPVDVLDRKSPLNLFSSDSPAVKLIYPVYNSPRLVAQKGIFTWHAQPYRPLTGLTRVAFPDDMLDIARLVRWPVHSRYRTPLVQELERLGINQRTIFPDLTGIAASLWQTIVLWGEHP